MNFQRHMIAVIFYELIRQKIVLNVYLDTCIYLGNIIRKYANTQIRKYANTQKKWKLRILNTNTQDECVVDFQISMNS